MSVRAPGGDALWDRKWPEHGERGSPVPGRRPSPFRAAGRQGDVCLTDTTWRWLESRGGGTWWPARVILHMLTSRRENPGQAAFSEGTTWCCHAPRGGGG